MYPKKTQEFKSSYLEMFIDVKDFFKFSIKRDSSECRKVTKSGGCLGGSFKTTNFK